MRMRMIVPVYEGRTKDVRRMYEGCKKDGKVAGLTPPCVIMSMILVTISKHSINVTEIHHHKHEHEHEQHQEREV